MPLSKNDLKAAIKHAVPEGVYLGPPDPSRLDAWLNNALPAEADYIVIGDREDASALVQAFIVTDHGQLWIVQVYSDQLDSYTYDRRNIQFVRLNMGTEKTVLEIRVGTGTNWSLTFRNPPAQVFGMVELLRLRGR